jgi:hypothetical protein
MAGSRIEDRVFDNGLTVPDTECNKITLCSQSPTTYAEGNSTYALGSKTSPTVSAPTDNGGAGGGRKVTLSAITDGTLSSAGTATHIAWLDTSNSRLLAVSPLASSVVVAASGTWTCTAADIIFKDPTE